MILHGKNWCTQEDLIRFGGALSFVMIMDKLPKRGGTGLLEKLPRNYFKRLNIPENLRKLVADVTTVLLDRAGVPKEEVGVISDAIKKKESRYMFDGLVASIKEERRLAVRKARKEAAKRAYQEKLESARNLKRLGLSDAQIASAISLSVEEVASL
ncbi:MAG: hypothetical protein LBQ57_11775 [Spirochaetales bacterium]|nr:hypothetical protein [Spirochaetales bacterium]